MDYSDWDYKSSDNTWSEDLIKRNDYYDSIKNKLNDANDKINDAASNAGNSINSAIYGDEQTGEGGVVNTISGAWNSTKTQYDETKETIETAKKILSYIPVILALIFFLFVLFVALIIYLCYRHYKKSKLQTKQIEDLTKAINILNEKIGINSEDHVIQVSVSKDDTQNIATRDVKQKEETETPLTNDINYIN